MNIIVPLVFLGVAIIIAMMMPMFTTMNIPTSDGLTFVESAFQIFRNETVATHNVTADSDTDTAFFIAGSGMTITTFYNNDTIRFESTGGGGGEANTGTNVGGQTGQVFRDKTGVTFNFKTISGSGGVVITNNANDIDIDCSACGSGSNALLDGSAHTDTVAQGVTRGSLIYGDSTPDWNELVIGGSATFIRSDGTDLAWTAISSSDLPAVVVETDDANTYSDGIKQTFNPDTTNAGLNIGLFAGEPSSPVEGDIFYDSTANQFKGRDDSAWINLGQSGGGGNTDLLDGSVHQDTVAQGVTRGSLIYGDSTPDWNELVIGGANTVLKSDGTDVAWSALTIGTEVTGASTALSDTANIAYLNTANIFTDSNMQTFHDDFLEIRNPANTFDYIFSTNAIVADRTVTLPLITTNDVFTLNTATQTLTNKGISLGSNTLTGTSAQFDTANSDGNFFLNADNISQMATSTTAQFNTANSDGTFVITSSSVGVLTDVNLAGCSNGEVLEWTGGTEFQCQTDDTGGGSNALLDGSVHTDTVAQGVTRGSLIYGDSTPDWNELVIGGANTVLKSDGTDVAWSALTIGTEVTGASTALSDTANIAYLNTANTYADGTKQLFNPSASISGLNVGAHTAEPSSPVDGDVFYDSTANQMKGRINGAWIDLGGSSGSNALLDGSTHTDTVAQGVTRGSLIYGDSTPDWNELVIGGSNTVLKSDGTDVAWSALTIGTEVTGASTALSDTANIAYLNTANIFTDSNMQTFHDDFFEIRNPANTFDYIFSTNAIVADRTVSIPLLTGNDAFVMASASQTLVNKGYSLGSNTLSGTSAQFDTANSDGTFFLNADNISNMATSTTAQFNTANSDGTFVTIEVANTYSDGIKQTFNPDGTEAGINVGSNSAEPSSPNVGDIFYDSTAGTIKGYDGAWQDMMTAGGSSDIISEGDSNVEVIDAGSGQVDIDIDGSNEIIITGSLIDILDNNLISVGTLEFATSGESISIQSSDMVLDVTTGDQFHLDIAGFREYTFNATDFDLNDNQIAGDMGCTDGQILEYDLASDNWLCGADDTGGGSNNLLDGSVHQDTVAQGVTRGSLIYGDSTPDWNELVIGGANQVLKSDGTDVAWSALTIGTEVTGASTALSDTANIAYLNTANIFTDSNMQTFHDDFFEIRNPANTFDYIFSTNAIVADRTVTLPLITTNDVFTLNTATQTLTNKGISLGSNTLTGTSAQFDTANSDGTFFLNADNISNMATSTTAQFNTANSDGTFVTIEVANTYSDGIKQTFNPDATEAGINVGSFAGEPSSPNVGDIVYDSSAGTMKGYDGAWVDLMQSGGGSNALLDGSVHTDTVAQGVTRGSLIYGDSTPDWNELVIGGANQVLKSDGTDVSWGALTIGTEVTGASTALTDTANIAYLNTANTWTTGTQNFGSLTIQGFDINCDEATSSCINVDTPDFIGVAEPKSTVFTCGAGMSQVTNTPNKRTEDGSQMDYVVCEFDTSTAETIVWSYQMPSNFDGTGTIDVVVDVVVDTGGNTASACFDVSFLGLAQDDVVNTAFGAVSGACTGTIVLGDLEKATMSAIASGTHTLSAGETAFIKLARDVAADSNTGDVGVISLEVIWN